LPRRLNAALAIIWKSIVNFVIAGMVLLSTGIGEHQGEMSPVRTFANDVASFDCVIRSFRGKRSWYHVSFADEKYEVLLECESAPDGSGFLGDTWILVGVASSEPRELQLLGLGYFSNPSICGTKVAYWSGLEDGKLKGVIADHVSGAIIVAKEVGLTPVETDFRFRLDSPKWKEGCKMVEFENENVKALLSADDG
jgi:hypothetical protein